MALPVRLAPRPIRFTVTELEPRELLTSGCLTAWLSPDAVLHVAGTEGNDRIAVIRDNGRVAVEGIDVATPGGSVPSVAADAVAGVRIAGLAELGRLTLGSPKVTDAGLARVLPSLTALTTLWVRHEGLGPGTLAAVGECKGLAGLELAGWPLDGDKLTALRLSPTVTRLSLLDVPGEVSDATLAHLARQKQLKALLLPAVKLGEERVVKLSKALSDTVVATADGEFANGMKK